MVGKRADMAGQTTGVLAPGARCFCCFEEGAGAAGAPGALAVTSCGCQCLTLFACPRCMWRLVAPPGEPGEVPRPAQMQCKVGLGRFSDAAVLMHLYLESAVYHIETYARARKLTFKVIDILRKKSSAHKDLVAPTANLSTSHEEGPMIPLALFLLAILAMASVVVIMSGE